MKFWPPQYGVSANTIAGVRSQEPATRNPMLLFSFVGVLLLRFDDCKLLDVLFQLPPRRTRDSAAVSFPDAPRPFNHAKRLGAIPSFGRAPRGRPTPSPSASALRSPEARSSPPGCAPGSAFGTFAHSTCAP
jgi:hypothetical protein